MMNYLDYASIMQQHGIIEPDDDHDYTAPPRPFRCSDGLCGQEDCARCRPGSFTESE